MEQIVLLCHNQLWVCQLDSLRGEAGRPDVDMPLIRPARGSLLASGQPGFGAWIYLAQMWRRVPGSLLPAVLGSVWLL